MGFNGYKGGYAGGVLLGYSLKETDERGEIYIWMGKKLRWTIDKIKW